MKATIDERGYLTVEAETPLESYALKKWCKDSPAIYPHLDPNAPRVPECSGGLIIKAEMPNGN